MFLYIVGSCVALLIFAKTFIKLKCGMCNCKTDMTGKVVIITGANTGIGYETAKDLAKRGAKVILACRNKEKGVEARDKIRNETGNSNVELKEMDLTSFQSVNRFCDDIIGTEPRIDVLINNAGTGKLNNALTEDKLPEEVQINHFGPFLLTLKLLPILKASAPSRIVNVSSVLHKVGKIDIERLHKQVKNSFEHMLLYSNTKLANVLFTRKLSKHLESTGVTANSLHPGGVSTDIFRDRAYPIKLILRSILKNSWEGAQTSIHLAVSPDLVETTGKYFDECKESSTSKTGQNDELADKLWDYSNKIVFKSIKDE